MKNTGFFIQDFNHLIKLTYSLADELASLHEFKIVYYQKQDENYQEWRGAIHKILTKIDQLILEKCNVPIFYLGLHGCTTLEKITTDNVNTAILLPSSLVSAVDQFATELCEAVKLIQDYYQEEDKDRPKKSVKKKRYMQELSNFSKQLVSLILSEIGVNCSDFSNVY